MKNIRKEEKKLTGYDDALPVAPSSKLNVTAMKANHNNLITLQ